MPPANAMKFGTEKLIRFFEYVITTLSYDIFAIFYNLSPSFSLFYNFLFYFSLFFIHFLIIFVNF